jgi:putative transposase
MRKSRFSEQQIIAVLKEHEAGMSTAEICRRHGISQPTFYSWKSKFSGLEVSEAKRLKALEDREPQAQEASCRTGDGQRDAEGDAGKKLLTPTARRSAVRWAIEEKDYSQRRACSLVGLAPKVYRHRSRRGDDGVLRTRLKELAAVRRRFGYRRLHLLLQREGSR